MMGWSPRCYIPSFVEIGPLVPGIKILKGFYHIWMLRPSWSCDQDAMNKLSFPLPIEATHKRTTCIMHGFWPPLRTKIESCITTFLFYQSAKAYI